MFLDIPHFDGTTDVDTGRPVDGANSWRSQFQLITFIASYGKGGSGSAAASATPTFKVINIPIDALPANRPAGWERFIEIDSYDGTFEKVGVRVFQPASSNGQANLHFHLYYQNHSPRQIFRAIIPGAIGRFANLRIAQFHDFGGQAYVMPRSAKGEQGDEGPAGPKGRYQVRMVELDRKEIKVMLESRVLLVREELKVRKAIQVRKEI